MLKYNEVYEVIQQSEYNNLLLGAGFSIAFNKQLAIKESNYFHNDLSDSEKFKEIEKCDKQKGVINYGYRWRDNKLAKNKFGSVVQELSYYHPKGICKMGKGCVISCYNFLSPYLQTGHVFTLNYDLLLYWASILAREAKLDVYNDGFNHLKERTKDRWEWEDNNVNVFYCHGALYLYPSRTGCFKYTHDQFCFLPLKNYLKKNKEPLYVSEETSAKKLEVINKNFYLKECLSRLKSIKGNLVVFGFSAQENDNHILNAIKDAQNKNGLQVFWGLYSKGDNWETVKERVDSNGIKADFYDSSSAEIWRKRRIVK